MTLRQLLLIPCMAPVLAVLILSVLNPGRSISIRILIWKSPAMPLGVWTAAGVSAGASIGAATALLLVPSGTTLRRKLRQPVHPAPGVDLPRQKPPDPNLLERDVRDPAPTVAVPFRIVQQPSAGTARHSSHSSPQPPRQARQQGTASDDWETEIDQDW